MWPWVSHRTEVQTKKHEQQSEPANELKRRILIMSEVSADEQVQCRDFPDSSIKVLSRWFRFFVCPWWHRAHSSQGDRQLTSPYVACSPYSGASHGAQIESYPYCECEVTASLGWMPDCDALLCAKSFVLPVAVTCYRPSKQKPTVCRRCRCSRTAARGFCGCLAAGRADVHWTRLMSRVCWWLFLPLVRVMSKAARVQPGPWSGPSGRKVQDFM